MQAKYLQKGDSIDYTPAADVAAGDVVVLNARVGIAKLDIKANTLGALAVTGIYRIPKDASALGAGNEVFWNAATQKASATSAGDAVWLGIATADARAADETAFVRLSW